jgi:hypothetical protein
MPRFRMLPSSRCTRRELRSSPFYGAWACRFHSHSRRVEQPGEVDQGEFPHKGRCFRRSACFSASSSSTLRDSHPWGDLSHHRNVATMPSSDLKPCFLI